MYNRYTHQRQLTRLANQIQNIESQKAIRNRQRQINKEYDEHYKQRVRNFLVQITAKPITLGHYLPPIQQIVRNPQRQKELAHPDLSINGFKSSRERVAKAVECNSLRDLVPMKTTALLHDFRPRNQSMEISRDKGFHKRSKSQSVTKLPVHDKSVKLRYKGLEQLGNNLKSMTINQQDRIDLVNKLQKISGKQFDHLTFSMMALKSSNSKKVHNLMKPIT